MPKFRDLSGEKFGRWSVISLVGKKVGYHGFVWRCQCDCGVIKKVMGDSLKTGRSTSCGCYSRERTTVHGMEGTTIYNTWAQMLSRCNNPKAISYQHYGHRGIKVCERWRKFENFYADMGDKPAGKTLDRIDRDRNYEPENVRWATSKEQNRNKLNTILVEWNGKVMPLAEVAEAHGISRRKLRARMLAGVSLEDALKKK